MEVKQYQVYWVNLDPTIGSEIRKTKPCLVISPNEMNEHLNTIIVAPFTSTLRSYPSRVNCILNSKASAIALDQVRAIDKRRLTTYIDSLDALTIIPHNNKSKRNN
ncbi:MAG: type II toxin-antitoxin system PemK/MazF family toxin [Flavisolibacter sp.]|nr:type II toxin-antitoxin system PemK/MazF family toxin [Flavisolibacter sp.]